MARMEVVPAHESRLRTILEELELRPVSAAAVILGWAMVWIVCVLAHRPLAGIAASACWLAAVLAFHAWADVRHLRKHWASGAYRARPLAHYHWWLAAVALIAGILFGYRVW